MFKLPSTASVLDWFCKNELLCTNDEKLLDHFFYKTRIANIYSVIHVVINLLRASIVARIVYGFNSVLTKDKASKRTKGFQNYIEKFLHSSCSYLQFNIFFLVETIVVV